MSESDQNNESVDVERVSDEILDEMQESGEIGSNEHREAVQDSRLAEELERSETN